VPSRRIPAPLSILPVGRTRPNIMAARVLFLLLCAIAMMMIRSSFASSFDFEYNGYCGSRYNSHCGKYIGTCGSVCRVTLELVPKTAGFSGVLGLQNYNQMSWCYWDSYWCSASAVGAGDPPKTTLVGPSGACDLGGSNAMYFTMDCNSGKVTLIPAPEIDSS
jgi:hypothetical protein